MAEAMESSTVTIKFSYQTSISSKNEIKYFLNVSFQNNIKFKSAEFSQRPGRGREALAAATAGTAIRDKAKTFTLSDP